MASKAEFGNFLSNIFNNFQTPQLFHIGDDPSHSINKPNRYINDMKKIKNSVHLN